MEISWDTTLQLVFSQPVLAGDEEQDYALRFWCVSFNFSIFYTLGRVKVLSWGSYSNRVKPRKTAKKMGLEQLRV